MENKRTISKANKVAIALGVLGTLFFISTGFSLLPWNIAIFAGIACYIIAGAVRRLMIGQE
jgi:hypothetical protein